ncbi:4Fe-4S binding domain protein [Blautia hydrogenotrophica DSM 10507]|uniref:4Fe-4S ferredoxin-type domain-containing protein n=4 Tax=Blautia hydrogenotrophica TaxID=53443 RepID=C0CHL8_BLAHS|nr:4Fe-4S binding domain protein [Blautia hydrogenotrophica DSM 10507]
MSKYTEDWRGKMKSLDELKEIREQYKEILDLRMHASHKIEVKAEEGIGHKKKAVLVCGGTGCTSSGSRRVIERLKEEIKKQGLEEDVSVVMTGCFGLCALGPIMIVYPEGAFYSMVKEEEIPEIVEQHLLHGKVDTKYLYSETVKGNMVLPLQDTPFYKKQKRVALRNCGVINPEKIEEYIGTGGYEALGKVLTTMSPEDVIEVITASGLRGRGGAGFPTGRKWQFAKDNDADQKYVCCNADEGDPGAFMDRSVLEGDPHVVLEAMAIAGYAIGATQGYIYVRAEYPIAVERLNIAIKQAREMGLLGKNLFNTGFDFDIELRLGAGAFVCGEETALMTSIEGHRGEPRPRPPFPAVKGLFEKPTILNNVETWANVPQIIMNGAEWFSSFGTEKSKGTKVFALGGKIHNTGLVEVPMGTTLREIVEEIGGGIPGGKKFKAAQTGGPSGGCIPAEHLDVPIDYENLMAIGSMMGSGGLIVMDEETCMVDIAKFFLNFTVDESCGKCSPCRLGTKRLLEMLDKITSGNATMEDLDKLEELCYYIKDNALCALGQTAPNPVLSTLHYFRDEYIAHIVDKKCPAGVCKDLLVYKIDPDKCKGCTLCARTCPNDAVIGKVKEPHTIDPNKCVKCGACMEKCRFGAIYKE